MSELGEKKCVHFAAHEMQVLFCSLYLYLSLMPQIEKLEKYTHLVGQRDFQREQK